MVACFSADNFMYISLTNYITIESYKINPVFNHVTNVKLQLAYLIALWYSNKMVVWERYVVWER